jgi:hypothetical protein
MRLTSTLPIVAVLALVAACDDDRPQPLPVAPLAVAPNSVSAYVAVSNSNPAAGTEVTVWVRARRGAAVGPIGSFTIRLAYDSTRLHFKDAARSEQGMVLANGASAGMLIAAGASADGFRNDELLAATFLATSANALAELTLSVTELNTVAFEDQKANMRVERALYRGTPATK